MLEIQCFLIYRKSHFLFQPFKKQFSENRKKLENLYDVQVKEEVIASGIIITPKKIAATKKKNLYETLLIVEKELEERKKYYF